MKKERLLWIKNILKIVIFWNLVLWWFWQKQIKNENKTMDFY